MSSKTPDAVGKIVIEDAGIGLGRTPDWPAIPKGLCRRVVSTSSTAVVCSLCSSPWGGLVYDSDTETFLHREQPCPRTSYR